MKNLKYSVILLLAVFAMGIQQAVAQLDSRNRDVNTVITDGLGQLPTDNPKKFNQLMSEFAGTGEKGYMILAGQLKPAAEGVKNAKVEYAISGLTDYISAPANAAKVPAFRKAIKAAVDQCSDPTNKAFLMTQLYKIAKAEDLDFYKKYLNDNQMKDFAFRGLCVTPDIDAQVVEMVKAGQYDKVNLAYLAYYKKVQGVEDALLSWLPGADDKLKGAVYNALTACGGAKSLATLGAAAKALKYGYDKINTTDDYLMLLNSTTDMKAVAAAAKDLQKSDKGAVRCAGLKLAMKSAGAKADAVVLAALKDKCKAYRNTALDYAKLYAGDGIVAKVAGQYKKLAPEAKIDVVRWLGNNKAEDQMSVVLADINGKNVELAEAAIEAAGRIGGAQALKALVEQLGGGNAEKALKALEAFNGSTNSAVFEALKSDNSATVIKGLQLASTRRMSGAYGKAVELTASSNAEVKAAAFDALKGVSDANCFDALCSMMEGAGSAEATKLQAAAQSALSTLSATEQYNKINARISKSSKPALYFPLLAQAGDKASIAKLLDGYKNSATKDAAFNALLKVNNAEMIDVLYQLAQENPAKKDQVLARYLTLVKGAPLNNIRKYQLYAQALELKPADATAKSLVAALGNTKNIQALMYTKAYLANPATDFTAAEAVRTLVGKNAELQAGNDVREICLAAQKIFKKAADNANADAGYAVKEIEDFLPKFAATGYTAVTAAPDKAYENFEIYADYQTSETVTVTLRDMELVTVTPEAVTLVNDAKATGAANKAGWNTLYIKMVNDRITVELNGNKVANNVIINNGGKAVNEKGKLAISGKANFRNVNINELPATPVFKLSAEEEKEGFEVLFDGRNLDKWQGNTVSYVPVDGSIYVSAHYGGDGNLYTKKKYSDFVYRFEFCFVNPGVNNGIGIRVTDMGVDAAYEGMEIQVLDHDDPIYAGLAPYQQHGSVYGIIVPEHVQFGPLGTWNTEEIRAVGDEITVTVNGKVICKGNIREACQGHNVAPDGGRNEYTVDHKNHPGLFNKEGYICFCGHGAGVKFRNVRILDLSKPAKAAKKATKKAKK